jgi:hypothetical protein
MAIRRPNKPPEISTDVFAIDTKSIGRPAYTSNFPVDLAFNRNNITQSDSTSVETRLTGKQLVASSTAAEGFDMSDEFRCNTGWANSGGADANDIAWMFKRAPGFLDIVATDYPGSTTAIPHNLGVTPDLIIHKPRDGALAWTVGSSSLPNTSGWNRYLVLNTNELDQSTTVSWAVTAPTATHFTIGPYPGSAYKGIFYLFATLPGISKVGSYSGTGNAINVNCGFTNGARFILIKRTDANGDWYVWDTLRGIVSGNDPYLLLNTNAAQVTNTDYIDPLGTGFTVTSSAPAALNVSGGTYLFLAIA